MCLRRWLKSYFDNLMKYNKKIPAGRFPHCHYSKGRKSKKAFESLKSAEKYISGLHLSGYTPYICPVCCKWHIGHNHGKTKDTESET